MLKRVCDSLYREHLFHVLGLDLQEQLESILFQIMEDKGFGGEYVTRYKMVTNFFRQRRPLIILICGVHCSGKLLPLKTCLQGCRRNAGFCLMHVGTCACH